MGEEIYKDGKILLVISAPSRRELHRKLKAENIKKESINRFLYYEGRFHIYYYK